ncbi:MAG: chemotaxis protein CheW [Planctomycetota bacterium]
MTANRSLEQLIDPNDNMLRVFGFWLGETSYRIGVRHVLAIQQDGQRIDQVPVQSPGLEGVTLFRGDPVPVFDLAELLGVLSGGQEKRTWIDRFDRCRQTLEDRITGIRQWLQNPESPRPTFSLERGFRDWLVGFECRDEVLQELVRELVAPLDTITDSLGVISNLVSEGDRDAASKKIERLAEDDAKRLDRHFDRARHQIEESMRTVLLFITLDGVKPAYALKLDEISDVDTFDHDQFVPGNDVGIPVRDPSRNWIMGFLVRPEVEQNDIVFNVHAVLSSGVAREVRRAAAASDTDD